LGANTSLLSAPETKQQIEGSLRWKSHRPRSPPANSDLALIGHQSTLAILLFESPGDEAMGSRPEHQSTPFAGEDRRENHRHEVRWWAQMEVGTDRFACSVFDLSQSGAKVRVAQPVIVKESVRLGMPPFGGFEGEVVWTNDGVIGVQFAAEEHHRVAKLIASGLNRLPK
jgi:hypothetical protein